MKPVILVFCEGETEEAYISLLKQRYRLPIQIRSKVAGTKISSSYLAKQIKSEMISGTDLIKTFLMYDLDVPSVVERLKSCDATLLGSNPCLELWFLLHSLDHRSQISTEQCKRILSGQMEWVNYQKGSLSDSQKNHLWDARCSAADRARNLVPEANPSSGIYLLIDYLESIRP